MCEVTLKKVEISAIYRINVNKNKYLSLLFANLATINNFFFIWALLKSWIFQYLRIISVFGLSLNFCIFLFFQDKLIGLKLFMRDLTNLRLILILTFRSLHLRVNYYDLINHIFQYYSIGMLLNLFKLESKSYRRSLKGVKVLLNFLNKKINKRYFRVGSLLKINGLTKNYLKFFYLLTSILNALNVRVFVWTPIKSWSKCGVKKLKSIKRRIRKKLIKFEQKS